MSREFNDAPAKREQTPLLVGLMAPSGGGKTFSALRLATGIQRVSGGEIFGIDTEARRMLHYADQFKFRHIEFRAPFGPLDYLAAIEHCIAKGAKTIIVDSMSHEHEGPGGVLEQHDQIMGNDFKKSFAAWKEPKADRRRLLNSILQMQANFVFCFRAKEKLKPVKGSEPENRGFMAIAGEEFVYEMTANALLLPKAGGVPTWFSQFPGESMMMKLPLQFEQLFAVPEGQQAQPLSEDTGEKMARWAAGEKISGATTQQPGKKATAPNANQAILDSIVKALGQATKNLAGEEAKTRKAELCVKYFACDTWQKVTELPTDKLENGLMDMKAREELL